jgi:SAM-dependent methyltransferase
MPLQDPVGFVDLFSDRSGQYAVARPAYPARLYAFIAARAPGRALAWDCATGNGQAALGLAEHFQRVEATDASEQQIAHAIAHPRVRYSVQPAEDTGFAPAAFDAVCVAQALHWFRHDAFFAELDRVLKPGGVFAFWGYDRMQVTAQVDAQFEHGVLAPLAPFWPPQNRILWTGYRDIAIPYEPVETPALRIELAWTLAEFVAYVNTWSAVKRLVQERGADALEGAWTALAAAWGPGDQRRGVTMPIHLQVRRKPQ